MKSRIGLACFALWLCLIAIAPAWAAPGTVLRVVVVESQNPAAYVAEIERGRALLKAKGSQIEIRVWRATYAGSEAGTVVASAVYPSLAALAEDNAKLSSDPELRAWIQGLDKVRKIVSDSLYTELTQ